MPVDTHFSRCIYVFSFIVDKKRFVGLDAQTIERCVEYLGARFGMADR